MRLFSSGIVLVFILLLGLALRLDFLMASHFVFDADEGIVGLMALHHSHGESMPAFYYGQAYMGSLEPFLVSLLIGAGVPPLVALKVIPLLFSLILIYVLYLLGVEVAGRRGGIYSALLAAVAPATLILWSSKARGGFIETVCLGAMALLWTIRWMRSGERGLWGLALIGFVLGAGWWINNQILYFMLPIGFVVLTQVRSFKDMVRFALIGFTSFFIGGLPFWIENFRTNFSTFRTLGGGAGKGVLKHVEGFFYEALPILFGAQRYWGGRVTFEGSTLFLWILLLSMLLVVLSLRYKQVVNLFRLRVSSDGGVELLLLFLFSVMCVFCLSSFGYLSKAPRYLLPIYAGYFPLLAYALVSIREKYSSRLASIFLSLFLILHVLSSYSGGRALPGEPFVFKGQRVAKDHSELISWLEEKKIGLVRTNYWIGYRLSYETEEKVRFLMFQEPGQVRIPEYEKVISPELRKEVPFVLVPAQARIVRTGLELAGYAFKSIRLSGYVVLYDIKAPIFPEHRVRRDDVILTASDQSEMASFALDNDTSTRWASGRPQSPGMSFSIALKDPRKLKFLSYSLGDWPHDAPVQLRIDVVDTEGQKTRVVGKKSIQMLSYAFYKEPFHIALPDVEIQEVIFSQNGSHPIFDWSIAEIELLY